MIRQGRFGTSGPYSAPTELIPQSDEQVWHAWMGGLKGEACAVSRALRAEALMPSRLMRSGFERCFRRARLGLAGYRAGAGLRMFHVKHSADPSFTQIETFRVRHADEIRRECRWLGSICRPTPAIQRRHTEPSFSASYVSRETLPDKRSGFGGALQAAIPHPRDCGLGSPRIPPAPSK